MLRPGDTVAVTPDLLGTEAARWDIVASSHTAAALTRFTEGQLTHIEVLLVSADTTQQHPVRLTPIAWRRTESALHVDDGTCQMLSNGSPVGGLLSCNGYLTFSAPENLSAGKIDCPDL